MKLPYNIPVFDHRLYRSSIEEKKGIQGLWKFKSKPLAKPIKVLYKACMNYRYPATKLRLALFRLQSAPAPEVLALRVRYYICTEDRVDMANKSQPIWLQKFASSRKFESPTTSRQTEWWVVPDPFAARCGEEISRIMARFEARIISYQLKQGTFPLVIPINKYID